MRRQSPPFDDDNVNELGVMTRERYVRLLNCSVSGCLFETNRRLQVGVIASIRWQSTAANLATMCRLFDANPSLGRVRGSTLRWSSSGRSRCTIDLFASHARSASDSQTFWLYVPDHL